MKLLITFTRTSPFVSIQSADSAEKEIAVLQANLKEAVKRANSTADWVKGELAFVDSEIADACSHLDTVFEKIQAAKKTMETKDA
jgi:hypothetical protein